MTTEDKIRHLNILKQEQERYMIDVANAEQVIFECNLKIEALDTAIESVADNPCSDEVQS